MIESLDKKIREDTENLNNPPSHHYLQYLYQETHLLLVFRDKTILNASTPALLSISQCANEQWNPLTRRMRRGEGSRNVQRHIERNLGRSHIERLETQKTESGLRFNLYEKF